MKAIFKIARSIILPILASPLVVFAQTDDGFMAAGKISWVRDSGYDTPPHVTFNMQILMRRDDEDYTGFPGLDGFPVVGSIFYTGFFDFGDGSYTPAKWKVIGFSRSADVMLCQSIDPTNSNAPLTHTYSNFGTYNAAFTMGERIQNLNYRVGPEYFRLGSRLNLDYTEPYQISPSAALPLLYVVPKSTGTVNFSIRALNGTGDPDFFSCRLATPSESGAASSNPAGLSVDDGGNISWQNTAGVDRTKFTTTQIIMEQQGTYDIASAALDVLLVVEDFNLTPLTEYYTSGPFSFGLAYGPANTMTDNNMVAGDMNTADVPYVVASWDGNGNASILGIPQGSYGGLFAIGKAINDLGNIAGMGHFWNQDGSHEHYSAFRWDFGNWTELTPGTYANGINNANQVVGSWDQASGRIRAFRCDTGSTAIDLGVLGPSWAQPGMSSYGNAINDMGQVAGYSDTYPGGTAPVHAFRTGFNAMITNSSDLGALGGSTRSSMGNSINNAGQVAGGSYTSGNKHHAFCTPIGATAILSSADLGALAPGGSQDYSDALSVNNFGHVVGSSTDANGTSHPLIWQFNGISWEVIDINQRLANAGFEDWNIQGVRVINDRGFVLVYGYQEDTYKEAILRWARIPDMLH